ncbi:MAG: NUDIX hydrolase [Phycisphaerae bacterium]|nr:NUDIX hydrolase [Phycisphaerae bacterium]
MIVHPGAVVVLAAPTPQEVLLIRNCRHGLGKILWELPAGTLEAGEQPAACAARELQEETGYHAERIEPLCRFYSTPGICTEQMHAFLATGLQEVGQALEPGEHIEVECLPFARVLAMIRSGEVEDAKTIATCLFFRAFSAAETAG